MTPSLESVCRQARAAVTAQSGMQEWTFKEALEFVSAARPQASPNAGFMARLLELDQKLHGKRTVKVGGADRVADCRPDQRKVIIVVLSVVSGLNEDLRVRLQGFRVARCCSVQL